jgi:uncharacterized heparinase superfamily protein
LSKNLGKLLLRAARKPPRYLLARVAQEARTAAERYRGPRRARRITATSLARQVGYESAADWWQALAARPYLTRTPASAAVVRRICPAQEQRILESAARAFRHEVDLLGSGPVELGARIDWLRDYKSGFRWPLAYHKTIDYSNPGRPSDVKFAWELSRMQWMIPLGQAYVLTADELYASATRELISDWIRSNPYAGSVNWSCTMEVALRIVAWTWFFHIFSHTTAWQDDDFRELFLTSLYLHADFTSRHLEKSDVNGNHYTADAAGLVFAGLFFGEASFAQRWLKLGWDILRDELPRQVYPDGVDFEASIPYHRLVLELFLLPALYRIRCGLNVPGEYSDRLVRMAWFTSAYSRPDGTVPWWGDADDARTLPLGDQDINDHRYLLGVVGSEFHDADLARCFAGSKAELLWLCGDEAAAQLPAEQQSRAARESIAFPEGGFYVLRNAQDHVFVDCGPVGLAGRGGHGHNDLLSFEATLAGIHLITDCGAYLYTADYAERNRFRSTASHNTPQLADHEINRFLGPEAIWSLHDDASHAVRNMEFGPTEDVLEVQHDGFTRLSPPVIVRRTFRLNHESHRLTISDEFDGTGEHIVTIRLHLKPGINITQCNPGTLSLQAREGLFSLRWKSFADWEFNVEPARVSPSYGAVRPTLRLVWRRSGELRPLEIIIQPTKARKVQSAAAVDFQARTAPLITS